MKIRSPFEGLRIPCSLVCEFFGVFSRFEFALKEKGFLKGRQRAKPKKQRAEPDWCAFACKVVLRVEPGSELDQAITYLIKHPPWIQMCDLEWEFQPLCGSTTTARAIDAARRVRNNLFHGGKHTPHSPDGHDEILVRCALAVLRACLEQDEDLRAIFEQTEF
ncbi:MAG: hypothetical protein ACLQU2_12135 [Candidatus Binataceae bacterium]